MLRGRRANCEVVFAATGAPQSAGRKSGGRCYHKCQVSDKFMRKAVKVNA